MRIVKGIEFKVVQFLMFVNVWWSGVLLYRNPIKASKATRALLKKFLQQANGAKLYKGFFINQKYSWDMFNPHWPSKAFNRFYRTQLREHGLFQEKRTNLRMLFVAITKRCPLRCEHCSEWDSLNSKDALSLEQFHALLDPFIQDGVAKLIYTGGEPLVRFNDLLLMIKQYSNSCDQWLYTSGYQLTKEKAQKLKEAGLNGVAISLDHHLEDFHNMFRGNQKSFQWVRKAVQNCQKVGIQVTLNACFTKDYVNRGYLEDYLLQAKDWNIPIVNIIEPRAVGHYANHDVEYSLTEQMRVEELVRKYNVPQQLESPLISYPAMFRKNLPCGGGRSYMFVDYDGTLRPCPFCKTPIKNHLDIEERCEVGKVGFESLANRKANVVRNL